jgi:hypothetical protein
MSSDRGFLSLTLVLIAYYPTFQLKVYEAGDSRITVKLLNAEAEKERLIQQIEKEKKQRASKTKLPKSKSALQRAQEENESLRSALNALQVCITFV